MSGIKLWYKLKRYYVRWNNNSDERAARLRETAESLRIKFTEHPRMTGETYLQHLWFTIRMSARFAYCWFAILVHGLFPFLLTRTTSNQMDIVYRIMKTRTPIKNTAKDPQENMSVVIDIYENNEPKIAVVGGGFSGALVVANLVKHSSGNLQIEWFEGSGKLGEGLAYKTKEPYHLLNVRADKMGAFPGHIDGFLKWLKTAEGAENSKNICPDANISADEFLPRALYSRYISSIIDAAIAEAKTKNIHININHLQVTSASLHNEQTQKLRIVTEQHKLRREMLCDILVLATGNLPPKNFYFEKGLVTNSDKFIDDVWGAKSDALSYDKISEFPATSEIVIIGTGLTTIDTILTLKSRGYKGVITAISRNGLLPSVHAMAKPYPEWEWTLAPQFAPRTALGLFRRMREEVATAEQSGYDWRSVIDSVRPVTRILWQQLSNSEKRKFLSRLFTIWNIHRHRMAPQIHSQIKEMENNGSLNILAAKIYYVGSDNDGITVAYRKRGANRMETMRPSLLINCTGPEYDVAVSSHSLLRNLRDRELITIGPLRAGIEMTSYGTARGKASEAIFPIGSLLLGEYLECTAIPELRQQAETTALNILKRVASLTAKPSAEELSIGYGI